MAKPPSWQENHCTPRFTSSLPNPLLVLGPGRNGPGEVRRSMGMRRLPAISLGPMKFAAGLRAEFADAACTPVPEYLAALMRQLESKGQSMENSPSAITSPRGLLLVLLVGALLVG